MIHPLLCNVNPNFYPRSPCGERLAESADTGDKVKFLSTLSLRRATHLFASSGVDFSISIHALLAESDVLALCFCGGACDFYPRSPCGERLLRVLPFFAVGRYFYPRSPCGERLLQS